NVVAEDADYNFNVEIQSESGSILDPLSSRIHVLGKTGWSAAGQTTVTVLKGEQYAYGYIEGIPSHLLSISQNHFELLVNVTAAALDESDSTQQLTIKIRKPPIILIHGYNTSGDWGPNFLQEVYKTHPEKFVKTERYGVAQTAGGGVDVDASTYLSLSALA